MPSSKEFKESVFPISTSQWFKNELATYFGEFQLCQKFAEHCKQHFWLLEWRWQAEKCHEFDASHHLNDICCLKKKKRKKKTRCQHFIKLRENSKCCWLPVSQKHFSLRKKLINIWLYWRFTMFKIELVEPMGDKGTSKLQFLPPRNLQ